MPSVSESPFISFGGSYGGMQNHILPVINIFTLSKYLYILVFLNSKAYEKAY